MAAFLLLGSLREESVLAAATVVILLESLAYRNPCGAFERDQKGVRMTAKILIIEDEAVIAENCRSYWKCDVEPPHRRIFGDVPRAG